MRKRSMTLARAAAAVLSLVVASARVTSAQDDALGRALRDELARSMKDLRLDQLERPYFIAYRVHESQSFEVSATSGSLMGGSESRERMLMPEVRVGDYAFDNTNFGGFGGMMVGISFASGGMMSLSGGLPLDDDYLELRRHIWLATDAMYKQAAETFAAKRAALLNRARRDTLADFSRATPTQSADELPAITLDRADGESLVRALSAMPELARLDHSSIAMSAGNTRSRLINSEGTLSVISRPLIAISASGSTQAADGEPLNAGMHAYARSLQTLPTRDQLALALRTMALRLDSLRAAPVLERYDGPVLVAGRAAAELFAETFAPALSGRRRPEAGQPDFSAMMEATGRSVANFTDKVGSRVLPSFLSVLDDPTISEHGGEALFGSYRVDDDGVLAQRKTVVDNGTLKLVLTTRTPVQGSTQSTGNRRGSGVSPSNLIVSSASGVSEVELRSRLLALVKQRGLAYGVVVRELGSASPISDDPMSFFSAMRNRGAGRRVLLAYRLYPDGREELVRGARLADVTAQSFKDILAVSSTSTVLHRPATGSDFPFPMELMGMEEVGASMPLASYVVPSMLFDDLSLTHDTGDRPKPPLSGPPGSASR